MADIHIEQGDITTYAVDAIVNAANNDLILGGGLAGAIARRGGPRIQEECRRHGPVRVGEAALTGAGDLPARYIIHAASMRLGGRTTAEALESTVRACLAIAEEHRLHSIAFPAIGTGIAGFPLDRCAEIMLGVVREHLEGKTALKDVYFVLFDQQAYEKFESVYDKYER
ncbi:MAG: macro domain-containing protein [Phycisphaerae bacterium]|nr:macro domain-containing protein [Phycisphaerae bacterium]